MAHPNRNIDKKFSPTPQEIETFRQTHGLTQEEAAKLTYVTLKTWLKWETGLGKMNLATWELLRLKITLKSIIDSSLERIGEKGVDPKEIVKLREQAGFTQTQACDKVYVTSRTWQRWEAGESDMGLAIFELIKIKTTIDTITEETSNRITDDTQD